MTTVTVRPRIDVRMYRCRDVLMSDVLLCCEVRAKTGALIPFELLQGRWQDQQLLVMMS